MAQEPIRDNLFKFGITEMLEVMQDGIYNYQLKKQGFQDEKQFQGMGIKIEVFPDKLLNYLIAIDPIKVGKLADQRLSFMASFFIDWFKCTPLYYDGNSADRRYDPIIATHHINVLPHVGYFFAIIPNEIDSFLTYFKKCNNAFSWYISCLQANPSDPNFDDQFKKLFHAEATEAELKKTFNHPEASQNKPENTSIKSTNNQRFNFSINSDERDGTHLTPSNTN